MLGIIKGDNRYEYLHEKIGGVLSNELADFYKIDRLLLPFGGIDNQYNIISSNINLLDILRNNNILAIYVGKANEKLKELCNIRNILLFEILNDEEFIIDNAHLTGLGIINYLSKGDRIINDYKVIIMGFGYVGFKLALLLTANKVNFSVYTTNEIEKKYVSLMGYKQANFKDYSIIINTIPHNMDIDYNLLKNKRVLDVSSAPYGFDIEKMNKIDVRYEIYSSIPAKFCPNLAANILEKYIEKTDVLIYN